MTEEPTGKSKCRTCKGELNPGAAYCLHCKCYQNWRRHLNLSSSVLALIVALVSVVSATAPGIINSLRHQYSRVDLSVLDCKHNQFVLLAVNQGNRRAVVASVALSVSMEGHGADGFASQPIALCEGDRVLLADDVRELNLNFTPADFEYFLGHSFWDGNNNERIDRVDTGKSHFDIDVIDFDGSRNTRTIPIPKKLFERFLGSVFPERAMPGPPISHQPHEAD